MTIQIKAIEQYFQVVLFVFDKFATMFLFGPRDLSHKQHTRGDKHNLRVNVPGWDLLVPVTCHFNSNQFEFVGQVAVCSRDSMF